MQSELVSKWVHEKTEVSCRNGMVVARHPLSAAAGQAVLRKGGNAVDAAIAASLVGSVVQPVANTIGGGGLMLISHANKGRHAINYLYQAPGRAHESMFELEPGAAPGLFGWTGIKGRRNEIGGAAVGVPGSIAGLHAASTKFGRLCWRDVVEPALAYARDGYRVDWYNSLMMSSHAQEMSEFPETARQFLRDSVYAYRPAVVGHADTHVQAALAQTLEKIAEHGPAGFYSGPVAANLVSAVQAAGGIADMQDLASYSIRESAPRTVGYRGYELAYVPFGVETYAMFFQMLATFDLDGLAPNDARRYHLIAEILKRCWHYRTRFHGDSDYVAGPWSGLRSRGFAEAIAATIDLERASPFDADIDPYAFHTESQQDSSQPGTPGRNEGTVHISAADADGTLVSLTETVVGNYGSLVTSVDGVLLNNGMVSFTPLPGHANSIAPGKRPGTQMGPVIAYDPDGRPFLTLGASGGRKIIPAVLQILNLVIDHGLSMQQAVSHPRLDLEGDKIILDARAGEGVARQLKDMGHPVELRNEDLSTFEFGNPAGIRVDGSGGMTSGVNPFQMTTASGY